MQIAAMNWQQVEAQLARDDRCVLPIGSVEQHAQLSLATDVILAEQVSADGTRKWLLRLPGEDATRGRIYLPINELQRFDVKAHEILNRGYSERFTALMTFQAERAHRIYDEALALLPEADRRTQRPGLMMANIYRTLLREIESANFQVLHQRISLTPLRKLWIAMRTNWQGR